MANRKPADEALSRYSRQTILEQIGKPGQKILLGSKVAVIGCGALGTHIANHLVRAGIGHLLIVDRDIVELNNLQRQILFDEGDVGSAKAPAAARKLQTINSQIDIKYLVKDVSSRNIEEILTGVDLVLDATDNVATRLLVNDACVKNGIPWIYAGVIQTRGMLMNILPDGDGPCLRCIIPEPPDAGTLPTCETVGVLNTIPAIVASVECTEALKILLKRQSERRLIVYDVWEQRFDAVEVPRNDKCECCVTKNFEFLNRPSAEYASNLCENSVQIIPPQDRVIDLEKIAINLKETAANPVINDFLFKFQVEGKTVTLFKDGRAIIKGIGDKGAAKSLYTRLLGL